MRAVKTFILALIASVSLQALAAGMSLDSAKDQGLVGEKPDGYLGIIVARPDVLSLVNEVNSKRKARYLELAEQNGITLAQVEKLAAQKAFNKTESGHYLLVDGNWQRKNR